MARIKIEDLPVLEELSEKEVKGIFGGTIASEAGLKKLEDDDPKDDGTKNATGMDSETEVVEREI